MAKAPKSAEKQDRRLPPWIGRIEALAAVRKRYHPIVADAARAL